MNFAKTLEMNEKAGKGRGLASKIVLNTFLNQAAISTAPVQVGDIIKFPDEISEDAETLVPKSFNGNTFFQIAAKTEDDEPVFITVTSLMRIYRNKQTREFLTPVDLLEDEADKENCIYSLYKGLSTGELLQELQGLTVCLKAQEIKEVERGENSFPISINAFVLQE